jgi:hypothetical protein
MPCSGYNSAKKPCGISTKNKYCHIHSSKYEKLDKDAKLAHRVGEQKKVLGMMNIKMNDMKMKLSKEKSVKVEALLENERLKKELLMLKDENVSLKEKTYNLKREVKDLRLTMKSNERLKNRVIELEDSVDQMLSMKEDYEAYQMIKHFEYLHHQMMEIYGVESSVGVIKAMKRSPNQAESILGLKPWKKYNELRLQRNELAHTI